MASASAALPAIQAPRMPAAAPQAPDLSGPIPPRRLFAFLAMCFGMFMAFLDIQIVSSSLAEIQAGLSASADEIPWVQTSYLIAEVIAIPLSGFLSRALGTRVLFAASAAGFTLASIMCGTASSIDSMIVWRALQGFIGGGMVPTVFASAYLIFQGPRQKFIAPVVGLIATLAPTIGPTVGGYLTDAYSWHWLFFINVIPGIVVSVATFLLVDFDQPDFALLKNFDWTGLISMAGFLGALEYVLEEGPRYEWLDDDTIFTVAIVSAVSAVVFFARVLTARAPIVDLRAFANRNFAVGSLFSFVLGIGLYGLTYLYPVYLAQVRGYDALMIGETMFVSGLVMFVTAPIAGQLNEKLDPRFILVAGFVFFAIGTWQMTYVTSDWDFWELLVAANFPRHRPDVRDHSGDQYGARHAAARARQERLRPVQPDAQSRRRHRAGRDQHGIQRPHGPASHPPARGGQFGEHSRPPKRCRTWRRASKAPTRNRRRLQALFNMVRLQAAVMSYADVFLMMTVLFLALAAFGLLMKRPKAAVAAEH